MIRPSPLSVFIYFVVIVGICSDIFYDEMDDIFNLLLSFLLLPFII